jgi:hypothetical protein
VRVSGLAPAISVLALSLGVACGGPFLLLPGGELDGPVASVPADWAFTDEISTIEIETNPSDPYSVNIWAVGLDDFLYLHAGDNRTTWIEHLEVDPRLRARIEDQIYELSAVRVTSEAEFARFADAYEEKFGLRPRNENLAEIYVIRLEAR